MNILNCKEQDIPFWADNDGGLWCYVDGCAVKVEESEHEQNVRISKPA